MTTARPPNEGSHVEADDRVRKRGKAQGREVELDDLHRILRAERDDARAELSRSRGELAEARAEIEELGKIAYSGWGSDSAISFQQLCVEATHAKLALQSRCRALEALVREAKWRCWQPGANGQPTISDWLTRVDAALAVPPTGEPKPLPDLPAKGDE